MNKKQTTPFAFHHIYPRSHQKFDQHQVFPAAIIKKMISKTMSAS
jgi:hypothetical protein